MNRDRLLFLIFICILKVIHQLHPSFNKSLLSLHMHLRRFGSDGAERLFLGL